MRCLMPLLVAPHLARAATLSGAAPKRVVFLGTPSVAARSLELLLEGSRAGRAAFELAAVVSQPPARAGRKMRLTPSPVHALAEAEGLPLFTPPDARDEPFLRALGELQPDLMVTAAYGCFLPRRFLELPKYGTLNIHPSLLPLYRGAAPVQRCLEAGDAVTGVSVAFTVLKMDSGPILRQVRRPLTGDEQAPELLLELFETGTEQLLEALPSVWDGSCRHVQWEQEHERATAAPKLTQVAVRDRCVAGGASLALHRARTIAAVYPTSAQAEAVLNFDTLSAAEAHNRVRGFAAPAGPGCSCALQLGDATPVRAKLMRTRVGAETVPPTQELSLGQGGKAVHFVCGDGSVLEVISLTLPGKKPVEAKSFWNGLNGRSARWLTSEQATEVK